MNEQQTTPPWKSIVTVVFFVGIVVFCGYKFVRSLSSEANAYMDSFDVNVEDIGAVKEARRTVQDAIDIKNQAIKRQD